MVGKSQTKQRGLIATVFLSDGRQLQVDFGSVLVETLG